MVTSDVSTTARNAYNETLVDLRLEEGGGGFKVASQHRRALDAALYAVEAEIQAKALESAADMVHDSIAGINARGESERRGVIQRHDRVEVARWLRTMAEEVRNGGASG